MGVDCGILGYNMYRTGNSFRSGGGKELRSLIRCSFSLMVRE